MKLSTRTRYGTRAILELAQHATEQPMQLKNIAKHQDISLKYLEQLIAILKSAGYVRSIRGSKGGYMLSKPADQIKLSEVFACLEGPVATTECVDTREFCDRSKECVVRQVWQEVQAAIFKVLDTMTLQDLVERNREQANTDYQI